MSPQDARGRPGCQTVPGLAARGGLVDELHLWLFPCAAGAGTGCRTACSRARHLAVVDRVPFASGSTVLVPTPTV